MIKYYLLCLVSIFIGPQTSEWINCNGISTHIILSNGFFYFLQCSQVRILVSEVDPSNPSCVSISIIFYLIYPNWAWHIDTSILPYIMKHLMFIQYGLFKTSNMKKPFDNTVEQTKLSLYIIFTMSYSNLSL